LTSDENTRGVGDTVGDDDLLNLVTESILHSGAELSILSGLSLASLLLLFGLLELKTLLGNADKLLAVEFLELGDGVLIDGVDEEEDFKALLLENLQEGGITDGSERLASEVVDILLTLRHAGNVI
jgi:hypothetical protein